LLETRGFHHKDEAARERLETVGATFLRGYAAAVGTKTADVARAELEAVPELYRGFAYEGAAMGYAMLDGLPGGGRQHVARFLAGPGAPHVYMVYVGVGWAMARLPRFRWPAPDAFDPLLRWLVLDGYGFHQAYFRTGRYVHQHYDDPAFPWPGGAHAAYARHAIDQGIGRALWFVGGTDPGRVAELIGRFPADRHADLYGGAGLAVGYAGGAVESELAAFRAAAGEHAGQAAQGVAFAAEARVHAGLLVPHTELATRLLCGRSAVAAAAVTTEVRPAGPDQPGLPAYERWRRQIADRLATPIRD
jgi:hypothetical protein